MTARRLAWLAAAGLLLAGADVQTCAVAADAQSKRPGWDSAQLERWLAAVERHEPGQIDGALVDATSWSRDDLRTLWIDVQVLLRVVSHPDETHFRVMPLAPDLVPGRDPRRDIRFQPAERAALDRLAERVRAHGLNVVVRRAALVHTDVATLTPDRVATSSGAMSMYDPIRIVVGDGRSAGAEAMSAHWDLARMLVANVTPDPAKDLWVRDWYRATIALGQANESFDSIHLRHALRLLPDDAGILFLAGCQHEAFAAPLYQEFARPYRAMRLRPDIDSTDDELDDAEAYFRRALQADPDHVEARMRWGRVLGLQGRHADAMRELERVLQTELEPPLEYYAALFLGAEHEALAALDLAAAAYRRAAGLFPEAPTPHLALARLARLAGDREGQVASLARALAPLRAAGGIDPWWRYRGAQGQHAQARLAEVRRSWSSEPPR